MMRQQDVFVIARPSSIAVAIAAARSGAAGVLDFEFEADATLLSDCLKQCAAHTNNPVGVKTGPRTWPQLAAAGDLPPQLNLVLFGGVWASSELDQAVSEVQKQGRRAVVESISVEEAQRAEEAGADAIILKGSESGGRIGEETSFVLLQHWRKSQGKVAGDAGGKAASIPVFVQGGVGLYTSAACIAGGAAGVVLDSQLLLTRESPLDDLQRAWVQSLDGGETRVVGDSLGAGFRLTSRGGSACFKEWLSEEEQILDSDQPAEQKQQAWDETSRRLLKEGFDSNCTLWGQDAALARMLAKRGVTVAGVIQAICQQTAVSIRKAAELQPLAPGAPLAKSHGVKYPLLQGPMTRVSDTAEFASQVSNAGALPFLALALMRGPEVKNIMQQTSQLMADRPWGVGLLGFLPPALRKEQIAAMQGNLPPYAIIAGGRPDQAKELEAEGVATYLHTPSPGLLRQFLKDGACRFVFEGRECGGHVGPRTSFSLWEAMCEVILEHLGAKGRGDKLHVVLAGGIHDAASAAMAATLTAPLADRGVKIGGLMGTAYLFTEEAVAAGAIVKRFQNAAVETTDTVLLQTGPGHAIRCIPTPYKDVFEAEKQRLRKEGRTHDDIVQSLEWMNIGRLRVASKGLDRSTESKAGRRELTPVPEQQQYDRGMYMVGQISALRNSVTTMAALHHDVSAGGAAMIDQQAQPATSLPATAVESKPCDIAIIGMSSMYPGSTDVDSYWESILYGHNAVTEVPKTHWDWRPYYDPDPRARDKIISKWGGFLGDFTFDPFAFGLTPRSIPSIEPLQLLLLESVRRAVVAAGYENREFDRENTCAVLGCGGGGSYLAVSYGLRSCARMFESVPGLNFRADEMMEKAQTLLPEWTEDSFPGILMNVAVGRVANRFNFGGANYAVDAACASSLASLHSCIRELQLGSANVAFAMGADTVQTPYAYMAFSKTHALSARGKCTPFDAAADGIVLSEGLGVVMLKRLDDAERDGDQIYAVIKGIGSSSDGRDKGLTAPNHTGQTRALRRAYEMAGISPLDVGLIEAHGTGTVVGDRTELGSLNELMVVEGAAPQSCALGSVKSMIGHSKCAAGVAGLIKAVKALHHKVLPPTIVDTPNETVDFSSSALWLNTEPRPWVHDGNRPRTAGVSAFGFGGTNVHTVLEEYRGGFLTDPPPALNNWPVELFLLKKKSAADLLKAVQKCTAALDAGAQPTLASLAAAAWKSSVRGGQPATLAVVASSLEDLNQKLKTAASRIAAGDIRWQEPTGSYYEETPPHAGAKVAVLMPGQGSQYTDMAAGAAMNFNEVRESLDHADARLAGAFDRPLGRFIFPPSPFSEDDKKAATQRLAQTEVAQPALGAVSLGLYRLMQLVGLNADMFAGHSYGEFTALAAAGAIDHGELPALSHARGAIIASAVKDTSGAMAAVRADAEATTAVISGVEGVTVANYNSPEQTVISGTAAGIATAQKLFEQKGVKSQALQVSAAFHSPLVEAASDQFAGVLKQVEFKTPAAAVYANVTGKPHSTNPAEIRDVLTEHIGSPVRFQQQVEAMHADGARLFIEAGPHSVLTGLVVQTLQQKPHVAVSFDRKGRDGLTHICHSLAQLAVAGANVSLDACFNRREIDALDLHRLNSSTGKVEYPTGAWLVNGIRAKALNAPEPGILGQPLEDLEKAVPGTVSGPAVPQAKISASNAQPPSAATPAASTSFDSKPNGTQSADSAAAAPAPTPEPRKPMTDSSPSKAPVQQPPQAPPQSNGAASPASHTAYETQDEASQVMLGFQNVMSKFLDTQRSVMLGYLQGGEPLDAPAAVSHQQAPALPAPAQPPAATSPQNGQHIQSHPAAAANQIAATTQVAQPAAQEAAPAPAATEPAPAATEPAPAAATVVEQKADTNNVAAAEVLSLEEIEARLLELVSERTGYPEEMLDPDLDLEADLGIDSIKRVEILATLAESMNQSQEDGEDQLELEKLTTIRTIRGIIELLAESLETSNDSPEVAPGKPQAADSAAPITDQTSVPAVESATDSAVKSQPNANAGPDIGRALVKIVDAPLPAGSPPLGSGVVIITDDGGGVAEAIIARLAEVEQPAVLLRHRETQNGSSGAFYANLLDEASVKSVTQKIRDEFPAIAGLVHAAALTSPGSYSFEEYADLTVKSLSLLARELADELQQTGQEGGAHLLAPTLLGGELGYGSTKLRDTKLASHGGVLGLVKCIAQEWQGVMVRGVDFAAETPAADIAAHLLSELTDPAGPLEVGYRNGRRVTWAPDEASLSTSQTAIQLSADDAILITGGARGITAAIAAELAECHQPHLIITGRSPLPDEEEHASTAGLSEQAEIKMALRAQMPGSPLAEVEAAYKKLMRQREINASLARIAAAGSTVEYHAVDVRDAAALQSLMQDLASRGVTLSGVIHAAGVIEDKLLADKTPESFDRVFTTKVHGAAALMQVVEPQRLKFCSFFVSIASRYGNKGQSDYAAANEVLSKLAIELDRQWDARVFAVAWGPWSQIGMVSNLESHLTARGIALIPPAVGSRMFREELVYGAKGDCEILVGGGSANLLQPSRGQTAGA